MMRGHRRGEMVGSMAYGVSHSRPIARGLIAMALAAAVVCGLGVWELTSSTSLPEATAVIQALATPAFLAAGALRLARWHLTEESHCVFRGCALLLMGGVCLPSAALAHQVSGLGEGFALVVGVHALSVGAILALVTVALVDDAAHRTALRRKAGLPTATVVAVAVALLLGRHRLPLEAPSQVLVTHGAAIILASAWLTLTAVVLAEARRTAWARSAAPLFAGLASAEVCRLLDQPLTTLLAPAITAAVGSLAAASALADLVRTAQDEHAFAQDLTHELTVARSAICDRDTWRADLAHDARGTLAGIRAAMQTLARQADDLNPATTDSLRSATLTELAHLEHMLRFGRADGDAFDVADVVRAVTEVRRVAGLSVDLTMRPARLRGASGDLSTVLQNLLINAQEHAHGAGVRVDVRPEGRVARIVVADDGPGMPLPTTEPAFRRGIRGPHSQGSGLGLSIAQALARRHGGDLELLPTTRGSTFVISWPLAERVDIASRRLEAAVS